MEGNIKWFNQDKRFGFISPSSGGDDIFFHYNDVGDKQLTLEEGVAVIFEIGENKGKLKAIEVRAHSHDSSKRVFTGIAVKRTPRPMALPLGLYRLETFY